MRRMSLVLVVMALCLLPARAAVAGDDLATLRVGQASIEWLPSVSYERLVLVVSGPEGLYSRQEVSSGERPAFSLFDAAGFPVPDGVYAYQLRSAPVVDPALEERIAAARRAGTYPELAAELGEGLPSGQVQSGFFSVIGGSVVAPRPEPLSVPAGGQEVPQLATRKVLSTTGGVVRDSLCVGFDCPNNPTFSDTTILMMEDNTRIKFDDTSTSGPRRDWEIEANSADVAGTGAEYLAVHDCGNSDQGGCDDNPVFLIEAGVRENALYVEADGDVGFGTNSPAADLHLISGDTPTVRLEQDTSAALDPQVWEVAGDENELSIRDVSGALVPLRIAAGAPASSLAVDADGDVGLGTGSPGAALHLRRDDDSAKLLIEEANGSASDNELLELKNYGQVRSVLTNASEGAKWFIANNSRGNFAISFVGTGGFEMEIDQDGDIGNCQSPDHDLVIGSGTDCATTPRCYIDADGSGWTCSSSRAVKENLRPVAAEGTLEKVRDVGVYAFDFIGGSGDRIGLMAEDFHAAFGRGSATELSNHDVQVALWLAVQDLAAQNEELRRELETLRARLPQD